jgi:Kef-type K+ transport system membrane component KefB
MTLPILPFLAAIDPVSGADPGFRLALALALILSAAKLGGHLAERSGQPAVLGELLAGVLVGNLKLIGLPWFGGLADDPVIDGLARIGVILLLFEVGLESTVEDMRRVGWRALIVAMLGVIAPWLLGWGVGALLLPDRSVYVHVFLGAILTATSVGITARVLRDLGESHSPEARVILGAAVIDDVLGLVILAVVGSLIQAANLGAGVSLLATVWILGKALLFLGAALVLGGWVAPHLFGLTARLRGPGVLLATGLVLCFLLAAAASAIGLAPIVGAYAAGLVLERVHYQPFVERGEQGLEDLLRPVSGLLVPVFFIVMGMRVDLQALGRPEALGLAALLILAAIAGKQLCALGGLRSTLDRLTLGVGMIPRGEVGLIFANIGLGLAVAGEPIVDSLTYSAVVVMVLATTLITPPALQWSLSRARRRRTRAESGKFSASSS